MNKNTLKEIKGKLLSLGLAAIMIATASGTKYKDENEVPKRVSIPIEYSNVDDYYKYVTQNGETVKLYKSTNVYLLFNKETYEASEYIYRDHVTRIGGIELYDLENEEMLVYGDGIGAPYNEEYYRYIKNNNYQIRLSEVSNYIEGYTIKEYYSLDEIKELETQIIENLRITNSTRVKTKK